MVVEPNVAPSGHGRFDAEPDNTASIPKIPFINRQAVLFQNPAEFVLKADGSVVFFLIVNIGDQGFFMAGADCKRSITLLPTERVESLGFGFDSFR